MSIKLEKGQELKPTGLVLSTLSNVNILRSSAHIQHWILLDIDLCSSDDRIPCGGWSV